MLQAVAHTHRVGRQQTHAAHVEPVVLVGKIIARRSRSQHQLLQVAHLMGEILLAVTGRHRDQHGHRHARNGRMHARIVEQPPDHHGGHQVEEHAFFAHLLHEVDREHDDQCRQQAAYLHLPPVKERDDQDCPQVVGDGQCREEYFERNRHAVAQHRKDADGKGDVRGRGYTPSVGRYGAVVEEQENDRRGEHAACGRQYRQDGLACRRKLPANDLPLYFESDGEKENHHQAVVNQLLDGHSARENPVDQPIGAVHHQRKIRFEQMAVIERSPGQVGQQHGYDHTTEQYDASRPGGFQKIAAAYTDHMTLTYPAVH